jgi:hypothetical protein
LPTDPAIFERAVDNVRQEPDYDGWMMGVDTVFPALGRSSRGYGPTLELGSRNVTYLQPVGLYFVPR